MISDSPRYGTLIFKGDTTAWNLSGESYFQADAHVSLPQERFQEIKRMMMVQTTHGLFLICTQKTCVCIYIHNIQLVIIKKPLTWKAKVLLMVANPHPL
jgi:hypothetical protein